MNTFGWMRSKKRVEGLKDHAARIFLIVGAAGMLVPLAWMIVSALKDDYTIANRSTDWVISLPARHRAGLVRLDAIFFVQEGFAEEDVARFESPDEFDCRSEGGTVTLTGDRWRRERDETVRLQLARAGQGALELSYDFREAPAATALVVFREPKTFRSLVGLNLWLFGDNSGHEVTLRMETDRGTLATSAPWEVNFDHWRELSATFREIDRLRDMPLLVPQGGPQGRKVWFDESRPLDLQVRSISVTVQETPYATALWRKLTGNFRSVAKAIPLGLYYRNTLIVALIIALGQVITSSLAAYAFARLRFPGRDALFFLYLGTLMIPGDVTLIPRFIMVQKLGLFDTFAALILPGLATAYGTFLLRQFFMTIPRDLEEAAMLDGCSRLGIYWRVILPLSAPALATLAVISFLGAWDMLLWPLLVSTREHWTLQVGLSTLSTTLWRRYNLIMAGALIGLVPAMIVFTSAQRAFREGIVLSGIKQ